MPTQPVLDDKPQTAEPVSNSAIPIPTDVSPLRHHLISIAAAGLLISFFLPWITMLGAKLTGMDIQKNFSSYKLVCVMPLLAIIAFVMNIAKLPARGICQFAGTSPYVILIYAAYRLNSDVSDIFKLLESGAWLALLFGAVLGIASDKSKKPSTPA